MAEDRPTAKKQLGPHLEDLVVGVFRLLLDVRHYGPDGLDDGDDEGAEGGRAGVVEEGRLDRRQDGTTPGGAFVAGEVPRCHGHGHHDLHGSVPRVVQKQMVKN